MGIQYIEKFGFERITVRNITQANNISTSPIYSEFGNFEQYKQAVLIHIFDQLYNVEFTKYYHDDPLINIMMAFVNFAQRRPGLFRALFVEGISLTDNRQLVAQSFVNYKEMIKSTPEYRNLSDEVVTRLHMRSLIIVIGIASANISGIFSYSEIEQARIFTQIIHTIIKDQYTSDYSF